MPRTNDYHDDDLATIGPAGDAIGLSPRMVRYLEAQGVLTAERGPGPRGHRHFPPPELHLGRAAALAMEAGHPTATLRAIRGLAAQRVATVRTSGDPLAWFELQALARAVEAARRADERPPESPREPGARHGPPPSPR